MIAAIGRGPNLLACADLEIDQDGRGHDRHRGAPDLEPDPLLVQVAHDAARRIEAEGAAAGEHDGVNLLDCVDRIEQIRLACTGRAAANVDTGRRTTFCQNNGAPGRPFRQREMSDLDPVHRRQAARRLGRCAIGEHAGGQDDCEWRAHGPSLLILVLPFINR